MKKSLFITVDNSPSPDVLLEPTLFNNLNPYNLSKTQFLEVLRIIKNFLKVKKIVNNEFEYRQIYFNVDRLIEEAAILLSLKDIPGINSALKNLKDNTLKKSPPSNPLFSGGQYWWELRLGCILKNFGEEIELSQKVDNPKKKQEKDILCRRRTINIDCKSFMLKEMRYLTPIYDDHFNIFQKIKDSFKGNWKLNIKINARDGRTLIDEAYSCFEKLKNHRCERSNIKTRTAASLGPDKQ